MAPRLGAQQKRLAVGVDRHGRKRIVLDFEADTFAAIRERALKEKTSFSEQVRLLCEWGLEDKPS